MSFYAPLSTPVRIIHVSHCPCRMSSFWNFQSCVRQYFPEGIFITKFLSDVSIAIIYHFYCCIVIYVSTQRQWIRSVHFPTGGFLLRHTTPVFRHAFGVNIFNILWFYTCTPWFPTFPKSDTFLVSVNSHNLYFFCKNPQTAHQIPTLIFLNFFGTGNFILIQIKRFLSAASHETIFSVSAVLPSRGAKVSDNFNIAPWVANTSFKKYYFKK